MNGGAEFRLSSSEEESGAADGKALVGFVGEKKRAPIRSSSDGGPTIGKSSGIVIPDPLSISYP